MPDMLKIKSLVDATEGLAEKMTTMNANLDHVATSIDQRMTEVAQSIARMETAISSLESNFATSIKELTSAIKLMTEGITGGLKEALHELADVKIKMNINEALKDTLNLDKIKDFLPDFLRSKKSKE